MKTTKENKTTNDGGNFWMDRMWQGAAIFMFVGLAYLQILAHVPTNGTYMRYVLAAIPLLVAAYFLFAPEFRK